MKIISDTSTITSKETNSISYDNDISLPVKDTSIRQESPNVTQLQPERVYRVYYSPLRVFNQPRSPRLYLNHTSEDVETILDIIRQLTIDDEIEEEHKYFGLNSVTTNNKGLGFISRSCML